jgi:enoyl reductase-like protein
MNRDELLSLCDRFATRRHVLVGRLSVEIIDPVDDPAPEIIRSFRQAEISESEKNALLSLVRADEEEPGFCDEMVCVTDPYADAQAAGSDDDIG